MTLVELYSKEDCHLCNEAREVLERVQKQIPFRLREFKLTPGDPSFDDFKELFPVVHINKVPAFKYRVSENMLKIKLQQIAGDSRPPDVDPDASILKKE